MAVDSPARIAILGAGPIGLEAALYGRFLGYEVDLFEQHQALESVRRWGHATMFSPFGMNRSTLGLAALHAQAPDYRPPADDALLTGRQWVESYLLPLAESDLLCDGLHPQTRVVGVAREQAIKGELLGDEERAEQPFYILTRHAEQGERLWQADVVIDATGTYAQANRLGPGGLPAPGERAAAERIDYQLPDPLGKDRAHYAGRHALVIGAGYSAATTIVALAELAKTEPDTRVTWIVRRSAEPPSAGPIERIADDRLPARDALAVAANQLASDAGGPVTLLAGAQVMGIESELANGQLSVKLRIAVAAEEGDGENGARETDEEPSVEQELRVDRIAAHVGYQPDASLYRELHVHQCYATEGPMKLAAALLAGIGADCLQQPATGPAALLTTEPHFYILGSKSYGRRSNFLYSAGLTQIRELFSVIGDRADLDLYANMAALLPEA